MQVYNTPPHVSGGKLCFDVGHPCVRPSVVRTSIRTSFPFDNLTIYKRISFKFCICICINNVSLGIVNGRMSIIYHRVKALVIFHIMHSCLESLMKDIAKQRSQGSNANIASDQGLQCLP